MAPDMLIGLDQSRKESMTVLRIVDIKNGKVVAMSDNVKFSPSIWTEQELKDMTEKLKGFNVSWTAEAKLTHKQMRTFKRLYRESGYKKPRIPRKLKKKLKTKIKFMRYERD